MARVSNPKKFSLVYHELGNEARSGRGLVLDDSVSDDPRSNELPSTSFSDSFIWSSLLNRAVAMGKSLKPIVTYIRPSLPEWKYEKFDVLYDVREGLGRCGFL